MEQQEQHELFFTGGNHSDNTPSMQPPNTYRGLKGYSLTSLTDNSYAFESEKGNSAIFILNPKYTAIGFNVMNHKVLIHSTNDTFVPNANRKGEVGMVDISPANNLPVGSYVPLYVHKDFNYRITKQIEGWCVYENSKIQRDYWSDDFNPPRVINFALPVFTTYYAAGVVQPIGTYMVVQGVVQYLGINYGPNEVYNVFTTNGINAYIQVTGPVKVIKYVPVELFDWMPRYKMGDIRFNKWLSGGSLFCGSYQTVFRCIGIDGVTSPWSVVTKPVQVAYGSPSGLAFSFYQQFFGRGNDINSYKGLEFIIDGIDTNFTTIQVAAIRSTDYNVQDQPVLFYEEFITSSSMLIPYYGNENLTPLTSADIQELNIYIKRINTIVPLKNRMTGGNWETIEDIDFDPSTAKVKCIDYLLPTDTVNDGNLKAGINTYSGHKSFRSDYIEPKTGNTPVSENNVIYAHQWYRVDAGGPIQYDGITYQTGDWFQGNINQNWYAATYVLSAKVRPYIRLLKYGSTYLNVNISNNYADNKNPLVDFYLRSNWRTETYRYGVQLLNLAGNPVFVRWMADKTMPSQTTAATDIDPQTGNAWGFEGLISRHDGPIGSPSTVIPEQTSIRNIGIQVDDLDIKAIVDALIVSTGISTLTVFDIPKYYSGFRIVRAPRDRQIICQGLVTPCYIGGTGGSGGSNDTYPASSVSSSSNSNSRQPQVYCMYSPEINFNDDTINITQNTLMRLEAYLGGMQFRWQNPSTAGFPTFLIDKFISSPSLGGGADTPVGFIMGFDNINKNAIVEPDVDWPFQFAQVFHNWAETNLVSNVGGPGSIGAKTYFFVTSNGEGVGSLVNGFGNWAALKYSPILVSFIQQKANLYGGLSSGAKANTVYEYCGHYQPFDTPFLNYVNGNNGKADNIQVFGGDCWISFWDICRTMCSNSVHDPTTNFVSIFPVESNINVMLREGRHPSKDTAAYDLVSGVYYPDKPEQWVYNNAYSSDEGYYFEPALPINYIPNSQFIAQAIYSNAKFPGEFTDAYRKFQQANKLDLEGVLGAIINMVVKKGALYAFQLNGISYIPVEEQAAIPVGLNAPMIIGSGGVMPRYDNTDNYYGNQHQFGLCETPNGFVWFDGNRKAFCYLEGGQAQPLSVIKGRDAFFQNNVYGTILENDAPVYGIGITSIYDARMKRVFMVFKDNTRNGNEFGIYFDIKNKQFLGESNHFPAIMFNLMEHLYSAFEGISQDAFLANHTYAVGDLVGIDSENYVCILGYTTSGFPLPPSLDATHWAMASVANQIFLDNTNDIGKFYGLVRDEEMIVCFNPAHGTAKFFNNLEFTGNDIFFDDVEVSNNTQTGADTNIVLGPDKDYWFYNNKHFGSIPMTSLGERLKDVFLVARFVKKNKLNNSPINSKNKTLRLSSIKTLFTKAP